MKRLFDILLVLFALPLWLPLLGIVALVVLAVEGRPVFFRQERAGKGGRPFRMLKLRTMRDGEGTDEERLTRLGRFLRASSLDELPELLHVLAGTMSLVGPRPLPTRSRRKRRLSSITAPSSPVYFLYISSFMSLQSTTNRSTASVAAAT